MVHVTSTRIKKPFPTNHAQPLVLSWVVDLEVLGSGPGSWILGLWSWVLSPGVPGPGVLGLGVLDPEPWDPGCSF